MKRKFLVIMMLLGTTNLHAQHVAMDAFFLRSKLDSDINNKIQLTNEVRELLIIYYPAMDINSINQDFLNTQPFFKGIFIDHSASSEDKSHFQRFVSSVGNLNVTNFADGLAKFLVQRSKEELNIAFFRRFQDFLKNYPEVNIIFPATSGIINRLAAYNYAAMLPALRTSFHRDLNTLSNNLINLRETISYDGYSLIEKVTHRADVITQYLNQNPNGRALMEGLVLANGIVKGTNPADVINDMAGDKATIPNDNLSNAIQFVDLISKSLRSSEDDMIWINKKQINNLLQDSITRKLFFGLLYAADQKSNRPLSFEGSNERVMLRSFLKKLNEDSRSQPAMRFVQNLKNVAIAASEVSEYTKTIMEIKNESEQQILSLYADYTSAILNFFKLSLTLLSRDNLITPDLSILNQGTQVLTSVISTITSSCYDIKSHNYGALILHTSTLISMIPGCENKFNDAYIKYGIFMANVIEAKSSDEVKAAIEAAVLPVGSSSIKRETKANISLNAFIGPFAGAEYLPALKKNQTAPVGGITAPVGVAFSWGKLGSHQKKDNKITGGKSISIFIPLIDVGTLAAYRVGDDSTKVASEVTLSNIISPGLYLYYGLGKCPISIGIGGQVGPQLRKVTASEINKDKNFYVRFGINVVVDIPLFNFYTGN